LFDIETNVKILKETLATLMLVDSVENLEPIDINLDKNILKNIETYRNMIKNSSRIKLSNLEVSKKKRLYKKSQSVYYPHIDFNAYYGINGGVNDSSNPNSGDFDSDDMWQAGVNLKWNVFDFGKKHSMVQKTKIMVMQSELDEKKIKRDLQKSLVESFSKIEQSIEDYSRAKSELALMSETQKIEQIRYTNGASDINDLLYTKARYQLVKSSYIAAKYSYQSAINYLDYILEKGSKK